MNFTEEKTAMNIDSLTIGEAKQIASMVKGPTQIASDHPSKWGKQIVVLDRGFVYVGEVTTDRDWCVIENAQNVRRWGTTRGLGELAEHGPLTDTKMDPAGTVRAPMRAVIALIGCSSKW